MTTKQFQQDPRFNQSRETTTDAVSGAVDIPQRLSFPQLSQKSEDGSRADNSCFDLQTYEAALLHNAAAMSE